MNTTMMPAPSRRVEVPLNAGLLAKLVPVTDPDLYADQLPGESAEERGARLAAAADITDDLVAEVAHAVIDEATWGWGA